MSQHTRISDEPALAYHKQEQEALRHLKKLIMKRITWLVLISYTVLMMKPVMPIVIDVMAHTFWEQQHMLTVHEVNGKFHVHNELVKASHQSEKDKQTNGSKYANGEYFPVTYISRQLSAHNFSLLKDNHHYYSCFFPSATYQTDSPPPEA